MATSDRGLSIGSIKIHNTKQKQKQCDCFEKSSWSWKLQSSWSLVLLGPEVEHSAVLSFLFLKTSASVHRQLPAPVTNEAGAPPAKLFAPWLSFPQRVLTCALKTKVPKQKAVSDLWQGICLKFVQEVVNYGTY